MRIVTLFALSAVAALSSAQGAIYGYYAQAKGAAQVYSAPLAKAKVVARVVRNQTLVVRPAGKKWFAVFLGDANKLAYVPIQAVSLPTNPATGQPFGFTLAQIRSFAAPTARPGANYVASRGSSLPRVPNDAREAMAANATTWEGTTPYKWGGTQLGAGIDCSGFVQKMAGQIGMKLPRTAAEQALVGQAITRYDDLQAGDRLYFWDAKRGKIGHTGIYVGGGYFTHSSSGHHGIARDYLSERWRKICVAARR